MCPDSKEFLGILTLKQVLQTMPSGLFLVDREQKIVYWNSEAERITGYSAEEALGKHCSFLEGIECGSGCGLYNPKIKKPIIGASCTIRTKAGATVQLSKNVDNLMHNGVIVGGIESFVDQTRQKNLEQQLRQHAEQLEATVKKRTAELEAERCRLSTLFETMDDPIYITRPDYIVVYANRAIEELFGPVSGTTCFKSFYQLDAPCETCPFEKTLQHQTIREERLNPFNQRTYEIIHTPLEEEKGQIHKLSVCRDITERKTAEQALRSANQELDAFVHTVSHDLRTPLTPIIGYAELLQDQYQDKLPAEVLDMVKEIEHQGQRMLAIMEDLLELAMVGRLTHPKTPLSVKEIVLEVLEEYQQQTDNLQLDLQLRPLPDARLPATLLHQLFTNLIGNALSYGCSQLDKLEIGGFRTGHSLQFYVRDFGPGIPKDEREGVFELFFRGSSGQHRKGTGIGLATVKKIARLCHGRAWAEESPGGGCTIMVELFEAEQPASV